jgi:hypothetical protein
MPRASVTDQRRMNPCLRSVETCDLEPKTGVAIGAMSVPSSARPALPPAPLARPTGVAAFPSALGGPGLPVWRRAAAFTICPPMARWPDRRSAASNSGRNNLKSTTAASRSSGSLPLTAPRTTRQDRRTHAEPPSCPPAAVAATQSRQGAQREVCQGVQPPQAFPALCHTLRQANPPLHRLRLSRRRHDLATLNVDPVGLQAAKLIALAGIGKCVMPTPTAKNVSRPCVEEHLSKNQTERQASIGSSLGQPLCDPFAQRSP